MRIAFFSDFSPAQVNGISDVIRTLMQKLESQGHATCLFAPSEGSGTRNGEPCRHVSLPSIGVPWAPTFRFVLPCSIKQELDRFRPDLLHTHTFGTVGAKAVRSARRFRVPLLGTQHTLPAEYAHYFHLDYHWTRERLKTFAAKYYQKCDSVTAPSHIVADELRRYGVTKNIDVVSNPVETDHFRSLPEKKHLKQKFGIIKFAVLCFGRLAREKNIGELLEAFALLRKTVDAELVIIGSGPEERTLRACVQTLGIESDTRFLGMLRGKELIEAINATDVYAITSRSENQSMTTMQAIACGLPVIGVNHGGLPEQIRNGENGFIVEGGDTRAFAARLTELFADPAKREAFGRNGRAFAERCAPYRVTERMEKIYEAMLRKEA